MIMLRFLTPSGRPFTEWTGGTTIPLRGPIEAHLRFEAVDLQSGRRVQAIPEGEEKMVVLQDGPTYHGRLAHNVAGEVNLGDSKAAHKAILNWLMLGSLVPPCDAKTILVDAGGQVRTYKLTNLKYGIGVALRRAHKVGQSLAQFDGEGCEIRDITLVNLDFAKANFRNAHLHGVVFQDCNFRRADFQGAAIEQVEFWHCTFNGAHLAANVVRTDFNDCSFYEATMARYFELVTFRQCVFELTRFKCRGWDIGFADCRFWEVDDHDADWRQTSCFDADTADLPANLREEAEIDAETGA